MDVRQLSSMIRTCATLAVAAFVAVGCGGGETETTTPSNSAPTVSLTLPAPNTTFASGAEILLRATATDADGTVAKVEFFDGTTKLGEDTTSPYEFRWTGAATGSHSVTARATDNQGAAATSASLPLIVNAPVVPNTPPTVSITAPANAFKTNAPGAFTWVAQASDSDGTIAGVEFFRVDTGNVTTSIGTGVRQGNTAAYQLQTTGWAAGSYTVVARATDDDGDRATSASVQVIVNALPTVSFAAPANNASFFVGSNVTLRATAADSDGSVAKVEFFLNGSATPLGQGTLVSGAYQYVWNNVALGAYTVEARVTDNDGATRSASISVSVGVPPNNPPTVTLATPTYGLNAPSTITLLATATDTDGTIASVTFRNGSATVGTGTRQVNTNNWQLVLSGQLAGSYSFTATAVDDDGAPSNSIAQAITIQPNVAPTVSITSGTTLTLPGPVLLTATASDTDGIAKVEFFNGATKLGEDTTTPYTYSWTTPAGSYSITAVATDGYGTVATSAAVAVTVLPDPAGLWSSLSTAQKSGFTQSPDKPLGDGATDAVEVLTAIGPNVVIPKFQPALGLAVRTLADFTPTTISTTAQPCPGGGTIVVSDNPATADTTDRRYVYNACVIGAYTFTGGTDYTHLDDTAVPPVLRPIGSSVTYTPGSGSFRVLAEGVRVTGNGVPPQGGEAYPRNALLYSFVDCTGTGASRTCMTNLDVNAVWGTDLSWTWADGASPSPPTWTDDSYTLNGVHRSHYCSPDPSKPNQGRDFCLANPPASKHIRFQSMTPSSGRAIVYGSNGYAVVTRLAPITSPAQKERVSVVRTIPPAAATAPQIYECQVGASSGDYSCVPVP